MPAPGESTGGQLGGSRRFADDKLCPRCPDLRGVLFQEEGFNWDMPVCGPETRTLGYLRSRKRCPLCRLTLAAFGKAVPRPASSANVGSRGSESRLAKEADGVQIQAFVEAFGSADWVINSEAFSDGRKCEFSAPVCALRFSISDGSGPSSRPWKEADSFEIHPLSGQPDIPRLHKEAGRKIPLLFDDLYYARLVQSQLDVSLVKRWLRHCEIYTPGPVVGTAGVSIRLIDVESMCLVHATTAERYLALSYVWGYSNKLRLTTKNTAKLHRAGGLRHAVIPRTIRDCIRICQLMGEKYLWVDSVCIEQDNDGEKLLQISQMEEIYEKAVLTIVNATQGDIGADSPLPGVQPGSRQPFQEVHEINGFKVVLQYSHRQGHFRKDCKWSTRAWTLQEELLSRRVLYVSATHAWFQCSDGCYFTEDTVLEPLMEVARTLRQPEWYSLVDSDSPDLASLLLEYLLSQEVLVEDKAVADCNDLDLEKIKRFVTNAPSRERFTHPAFFIDPSDLREFQPWTQIETKNNAPQTLHDLCRDIESYSRRQITYDSDILLATGALFRRTTQLDQGRETAFQHGLPTAAFDYALTFVEDEPTFANRRVGFPSWSWAGWKTAVWWSLVDPFRPDHWVMGADFQLHMSRSLFSAAVLNTDAMVYDELAKKERDFKELRDHYGLDVAPRSHGQQHRAQSLLFHTTYAQLRVDRPPKIVRDVKEIPPRFRHNYDRFKAYSLRSLEPCQPIAASGTPAPAGDESSPDSEETVFGVLRLEEQWRRSMPDDLVLDFIVIRASPCGDCEDHFRPAYPQMRKLGAQPPDKWTLSLLCIRWLDNEVPEGTPRRAERLTGVFTKPTAEEWMALAPKPREVLVELV